MVVTYCDSCGAPLRFTTSYPVGPKTFKRMQCSACDLVHTVVVQITVLQVLRTDSAYVLAKKEKRGLEQAQDPAGREQQSDSSLS